jgi:O-antigen biosynthesis protein WbqP
MPGQATQIQQSDEKMAGKRNGLMLKRLTDLIVSTGSLIALLPVFVATAIAIKIDSRGPVVFTQKRVGRDGTFFEIYKFRTMRHGTPDLPTDQMLLLPSPITAVGAFLRHYSLDELPQLFNVLKGQMSLVGPRPALYNQTALTAMRLESGVLRFPPGITGWAQINGRDELRDEVKVAADKWYCDNWSYWLDWRIIGATFGAVLSKRGAN